jgi:hypothetical protein
VANSICVSVFWLSNRLYHPTSHLHITQKCCSLIFFASLVFFCINTYTITVHFFYQHHYLTFPYSDYLYAALQMSVQDANMSSDTDMSKVFEDRTFVSSILNSVCIILKLMAYRYILDAASIIYWPFMCKITASWC